jgi:hypothetical protein
MKEYVNKIINRNIELGTGYKVGAIVPDNYSLYDKVIAYIVDGKSRVIKLDDMVRCVVLYDKDGNKNDLTLITNPITLQTSLFNGIVKVKDIEKDTGRMILLTGDYEFKMGRKFMKRIYSDKKNKILIERFECRIMTLRDLFTSESDPLYITVKKPFTDIFPSDYYSNKKDHYGKIAYDVYHPKTLVYLIQYKSTSGKYKNTILIGADANSDRATGYEYKKAKFNIYMMIYADKIKEKGSFITPILWHYAKDIYKKSRIITL